jgi:hypothetical protein
VSDECIYFVDMMLTFLAAGHSWKIYVKSLLVEQSLVRAPGLKR